MGNGSKVAVIADDDEWFRIALTAILSNNLGFSEVIGASCLDDAIDELSSRKGQVQIALFDLEMPGMESPASLKAVKDFDDNLKIAVVSGSTRRSDILTALETGVNGYVPKGLGAADLTVAIGKILEGTVYVPALLTETSDSKIQGHAKGSAVADDSQIDAEVVRKLTPRQRDVLRMLVAGKSTKEMAAELGLSSGTIKIHLKALYKGLKVNNRASAAVAGSRFMSSGLSLN